MTGSPPAARPDGARLPIAFGPVRSRRLGWSLGINNVRPKSCTYSCVYCQVGASDRARRDREAFFDPAEVVAAVGRGAAAWRASGQPIDYATFVPDGEPSLDLGIGAAIRGIQAIGLPVAVLTSGSAASGWQRSRAWVSRSVRSLPRRSSARPCRRESVAPSPRAR